MIKQTYIRDGRAPIPKSESTSRIMSLIRAKNTKPELLLRKELRKVGLKGYKLHWNKIPGRPDICYPDKKFAIFVNGCYWHRCPYCKPSMPKSHKRFWKEKFEKNVIRDRIKTKALRQQGWFVKTIWECQVKKRTSQVIEKLSKDWKKLNNY